MKKAKNLLKYALVVFFWSISLFANACTIFMANDGKNVWIGNNEDEVQTTKYRMWFYPAKKSDYGYAIWTDLNIKLFSSINLNMLAYLNPQGGLNEHGLFLDYTAIDKIPIVKDEKKEDRKNK